MAPSTLTITINNTNAYHIDRQGKTLVDAIAKACEMFLDEHDYYKRREEEKAQGAGSDESFLLPEDDPYWFEEIHTINVVDSLMEVVKLGWDQKS